MSSTRHAKPGSPLKQSKFSSSAEFETGLIANLVARRCSVLENPEERELVWFLQLLSHQPGGLEKVARELSERFSDRVGTFTMLKYGTNTLYTREQSAAIRSLLPLPFIESDSGDFKHLCRSALSNLAEDLKVFCLNPTSLESAAPWYFADLPKCLCEFHDQWVKAHRESTVTTELGSKLCDALDYASESKCMVLIEGLARTGKTFSAKSWCHLQPGRARYVQVPCTNDEIGFYRTIAKALGVSSGLSWKACELRERIEAVLQSGDLVVVFDEAHYLWPNLIDPRTLPARINWIMTALVNYGVPVGLIATPQFLKTQKVVESKTRWTSEQFTGRIYHYEPLPESLSEKDLSKVASALLPEGDDTSVEILVRYAQASAKYLAGIEAVVRRARYIAKRDGRDKVNRTDIKNAVKESVMPSDSALAQSSEAPSKSARKRTETAFLTPFHRAGGNAESDFVDEPSTQTNRLNLTRADCAETSET